ncbi:hypothetical protein [Celeribacter arenosi]|uniref:Uncharacterized protein n=1 Tax=Celeribacter arenosi TaxID=792649 RepID=A0ABP7KCF1_9RHOB
MKPSLKNLSSTSVPEGDFAVLEGSGAMENGRAHKARAVAVSAARPMKRVAEGLYQGLRIAVFGLAMVIVYSLAKDGLVAFFGADSARSTYPLSVLNEPAPEPRPFVADRPPSDSAPLLPLLIP